MDYTATDLELSRRGAAQIVHVKETNGGSRAVLLVIKIDTDRHVLDACAASRTWRKNKTRGSESTNIQTMCIELFSSIIDQY